MSLIIYFLNFGTVQGAFIRATWSYWLRMPRYICKKIVCKFYEPLCAIWEIQILNKNFPKNVKKSCALIFNNIEKYYSFSDPA